ncbi:SMI1/KNR4 family protein [Aliikangiella sp. IMCC44653]
MQEAIEALQAAAIPQTTPLELPDHDLLVEIEEEILLPIPFEFKQFLLQVSNLVIGSLEPVTASDPQAHTHLPEVTAEAWALGIERDLIPICHHGDDYYCVTQSGEVQLWRFAEQCEQEWEDVWEWALDVWLQG